MPLPLESQPAPPLDSLLNYLGGAHDGFFLIREDMTFQLANDTLIAWMKLKQQIKGLSILHSLIGLNESVELFMQQCRVALVGQPVRFECLIRPPQCLPRWLEVTLHRPSSGKELLGVARDISHHKQEIERLQRQASHDELTGLLNRKAFTRILQTLPAAPRSRALLLIDLEHFKIINDTCGQDAGDDLLRQVSAVIGRSLGKHDILARIGGDEFAMLCMDCPLEMAHEKACVIRDHIAGFQFFWDQRKFEIGASIGITIIDPGSSDRHATMNEVDSACHFARQSGHNRIHVYSPNGKYTYRQQETEWISRIAQAFEDNRFQLFYQNILPIATGCGCYDHLEILIRMLDDKGNLVEPGEFLPAAEKYNLMPLIDRWVIRTLFSRNAAVWRTNFQLLRKQGDAAMPLCCINLSGASLNDDYFPEFLRDQIALHQVPPEAVCFEITETVAVNNLEKLSGLLVELRAVGFRFALDDFGKGMSSFSYLKSLPVDFLKIDGSLVENIDEDKTDLCMVEAINKIAQEMGIKTIAEFVKNQAVIDKLQSIGVNYAQGFGIHRPEHLH